MTFRDSCTRVDGATDPRNRQGILSEFNVVRSSLIDNTTTPLQVGNGNFAFNVDNTGMQVCASKLSFSIYKTHRLSCTSEFLTFQYSVKLGLAQ